MAATEAVASNPTPGPLTDMERLLAEQMRLFCSKCDELLERGYRDLIRGTPAPAASENHRRELQWAVRSAHLYLRLAALQDFADRRLAELLAAKLRQLEEQWNYIYEPPSHKDAERLQTMIEQAFPDESRA